MLQNGALIELEKLELPTERIAFCRLCLARDNLVQLVPSAVTENSVNCSASADDGENDVGQDDDTRNVLPKKTTQLIELVFECTNIRLSPEDEPGCSICGGCRRSLADFYRFRSQAKRVDELIKSKQLDEANVSGALITVEKTIADTNIKELNPTIVETEIAQSRVGINLNVDRTVRISTDSTSTNNVLSRPHSYRKRNFSLLCTSKPSVMAIKRPRLKPMIPILSSGDSNAKYKCRYCPKSFKTETGLTEHSRQHYRPHQCPNCLEQFQHAPSLARHVRNRTCFTFTKYRCRVCTESFLEQAHWAEHIKIHASEYPHQCQECLSQFKHKATLRRHVNTVHLLQY
ncbi:zinc finger protein 184-like [Uranotaenia lowii]|uniref:zinc finger protein 184-like n=1 Tax=Uranotaenia lowii TaxID=190385 RepID=UPI00247885A4|nr:zinc finger protein 184-like [Uranotaenia lowii]